MSRRPKPWVCGLLIQPLGIYIGFVSTCLPFLLSRAHVGVDVIAHITSVASLPSVVCFMWAPLADVRFRRRAWLVTAAAGTALCIATALTLTGSGRLAALMLLTIGGGIGSSLVLSTCGALMATTFSSGEWSQACSWYEAGKLGGSSLGAALILWLVGRIGVGATGLAAAILIIAPALVALTLPEAPAGPTASMWKHIRDLGADIRAMMRGARQWASVFLLLSPVGSGAAVALLPAVARYYNVGFSGVIWINGVGGGIVLALGALSSVLLPGTWDRRITYAAAGLGNAMAALVLLTSDRPGIYYAGTICYLGTTGLCWARYAALLVETVGPAAHDVSTRFSILAALGNLPLAYMLWLDGVAFKHLGVRGMFWTDAAGNIGVFLIVACVFVFRAGRARLGETTV